MSIKNIIWDWNGTIVDDAWVFVGVMNSVLKKNNLPLTTLKSYRKEFCFPIQDYWRGLGFQFTEDSFNRLNEGFIHEYQKKMFLPQIHKGLRVLFGVLNKQNISQFILSASEKLLLKRSINHYKLENFFKGVYGVDNLNAQGKESAGLALLLEHNLSPEETVLIGDTEYDCRVADSLGCAVLLVSYGHINGRRLSQTGRPVVSSVKELEDHLSFNQ